MPKDVDTPTAEQIEAHNATHILAKMWCPAYVEGKEPNSPQSRVKDQGRDVPEVGVDYVLMRDAHGEERLTTLAMEDRDTMAIFCDVVEAVGRGIEGTIERVIENTSRLRYQYVIVKSDQEPVRVYMVCGIISAREEPAILELFASRRFPE